MGQITPVHVIIAIIGVLLVNGSTQEDRGDGTASTEGEIEEEVGLLCDELEEEKYSQNMTRFKLNVLPVESWKRHEKVSSLWSVGFISQSLDVTYEQLLDLLTPQWIEDEFDKEQKRKMEQKKTVIPQNPLQVNAVVVVDNALDNMVANSTQFVTEFFPLVNHLLGSIGIEIRITDILLESPERRFGLIHPLDDKHGLKDLYNPSAALQWEVEKRELNPDVVLMLSGLDICQRIDSADQTFTKSYDGKPKKSFDCSVLGSAGQPVSSWPFYREHNCAYRVAVIEVEKPEDRISRWLTAIVAAHEVVHLIGSTSHDGEDDQGGGPGGQDCTEENKHIMAPTRDVASLYRMCKAYEPWSECTIRQVEFYTANWTRFCPGSFFTHRENPLYALLILPSAAILALVFFCFKKRSRRVKKLLEDETERLKAEAFVQSGRAFRDLADAKHNIEDANHNIGDANHNIGGAKHNNQDSIHENSLLSGTQEPEIVETFC